MGRKNPKAAIYKLTHKKTGKIYIGETSNFVDRMSSYRTTARGRNRPNSKRPIDIAVMNEGFEEAFDIEVLVSEDEIPLIKDVKARRILEAAFIKQYRSTDPDIGLNSKSENLDWTDFSQIKHIGRKHSTRTKALKSEAILVYDRNLGNSVTLYTGAQACADFLGISDRSIIISAIKKGKTVHGRTFFKLNYEKRIENARTAIRVKINSHVHGKSYTALTGTAKRSLERYLEGLEAVNDWCRVWGFKEANIESLLAEFK